MCPCIVLFHVFFFYCAVMFISECTCTCTCTYIHMYMYVVCKYFMYTCIVCMYGIQYRSDTRYKARVTRVCRRQTHLYTDHEANTCLYMVKWVYTRRQTRLHKKANGLPYTLYLICTVLIWTCTQRVYILHVHAGIYMIL